MVFEFVDVSEVVRMMVKLDLCYEEDPSDGNSVLFVPLFLEDRRLKPQKWEFSSSDCIYVGRHLECAEGSHLFLTPGFFPRLQV